MNKITFTVEIRDKGGSTISSDRLSRATGEMITKVTRKIRRVARSYEGYNSMSHNELGFEIKITAE